MLENTKVVKVTWFASELFEGKDHTKLKNVFLGVCGESKKVFSVARKDNIKPLLVTDVYITDGKCEEANRCMCFSCPLNTTTYESITNAYGFKPGKDQKASLQRAIKERKDTFEGIDFEKEFDLSGGYVIEDKKTP